jgi:peptidoglycan hydrolase CwlO-like protein
MDERYYLGDYVQKESKLQKLQSSIEQQARVRNEIQQLEQYIEPTIHHRRDQSSRINETKQEPDSTNDRLLEIVNEIDEEIVEADERYPRHQNHAYDYSFNKLKEYREENYNE